MFVMSVIAACVLTALVAPAVEAQAADLFTPLADPPPHSDAPPDLTLRSRAVHIDLSQLAAAQTAVTAPPAASGALGASPPAPSAPRSAPPAPAASPPAQGVTLTLNLFDDVVVQGRVAHTAPTFSGGYSLSGHLVDEPLGTFTLVVNGETVAGSVQTLAGTYRIRSVGAGVYAVNEIDHSRLPECGVDELTDADHPHPH